MSLPEPPATWVGKLGGSLLEPPLIEDLPDRLGRIVSERGGERPLLINGGGATVEQVRSWDATYSMGEEFSHWLSVSGLTFNARALCRILPSARLVATRDELHAAWEAGRLPVLCCEAFLREVDERRSDPLPRRWSITSDSIAARVAEHHRAAELALLKSTAPVATLSRGEAARQGLVDCHFPAASVKIPRVVVMDLRHADPSAVELRS